MNEFFYDSCLLIFKFLIPGILLAIIYDCFRLLRVGRNDVSHKPIHAWRKKYFPHLNTKTHSKKRLSNDALVFIEDIFFCLIAALTEILATYHINRGEIRIYCLFLSVIGFFIYQKTLGRLFLFLSTKILYLLRYMIYYVGCVILSPSLFFWKKGKRIGKGLKKYFQKDHSNHLD